MQDKDPPLKGSKLESALKHSVAAGNSRRIGIKMATIDLQNAFKEAALEKRVVCNSCGMNLNYQALLDSDRECFCGVVLVTKAGKVSKDAKFASTEGGSSGN